MHRYEIQNLITLEDWRGLYEYINTNEIPPMDLNAIYNYQADNMQFIAPGTTINPRFVDSEASLLTIVVQRGQLEIVKLLLSKNCKLNPENGLAPLEVLFSNLFFLRNIEYIYQNLSNERLELIRIILIHAVENNVKLDLSKIPLEIKTYHFGNNTLKNFLCYDREGNIDRISYLQLICGGYQLEIKQVNDIMTLPKDKILEAKRLENKVLEIIELFVKAGADIHYCDYNSKTVLDHISEVKILDRLLETADFKPEFISAHIKKYKSEFINAQINNEAREPHEKEKNLLKQKVDILSAYLVNKFEKIEKRPAVQAFMQHLPQMLLGNDNDKEFAEIQLASEAEEAFIRYLNREDILNLKLTCKAIYERANEYKASTHIERIKQERDITSTSCVMM